VSQITKFGDAAVFHGRCIISFRDAHSYPHLQIAGYVTLLLLFHRIVFFILPATNKSEIMKNVVFVLSGFQNPFRSELRNKATTMGAIYNDDWDETCTHLM